jgi:exodeoxyribonuclease V gamma subunit
MAKKLQIFFSNRLEVLYQQLKSTLFGPTEAPLMRRLVVVYGPAMKTWLMLRMAQDPDLNVAMGVEFIYLNQAFETLLKLSMRESCSHLPAILELALAIEKELMAVIHNFKNLTIEEQHDWKPLIQYLKLNPHRLGPKLRLSRKMEKRLISLSQHIARLFQEYGRFAPQMVSRWELPQFSGWQPRLWRQLFEGELGWTYPARALLQDGIPTLPFTVHFFSISFVTTSEFAFLNRLSEHVPVNYYLLSPCAVFWSDIRSDRESAYLQTYWQQKLGAFSTKVLKLEELLRDRNPLLANFGRMGREMACQIEESQAITHAHYVLPQHVKELNEELFVSDDLYLVETQAPLSLLHAIQADLLMMRNPQGLPPIPLEESQSLQVHVAPSKRREVQILYHNLLNLMAKEPSLCPSDIIVMAPQISEYVPYIQSVFGLDNSKIDFQVLDLGMQTKSEIVQGFLQLLELCESRWNSSNLLQLFEHSSFQRRQQLTSSDYLTIQEWVEQAGIRWGDDWLHRNELLQRRHCEQGMVEESAVGTWDYGLARLLLGLTTIIDERSSAPALEVPPCSVVDFSQSELLGRWIRLLHSLRDDLSPLEDHTRMTMEDWSNFLSCLLDHYFQPNFDDAQAVEEYEDLKAQFGILRTSTRFFKETLYPFASVKAHLLSLLHHRGITYREEHLQAVRFCSLMPLRSIPAKVIALLGMQEGAFPRSDHHSSLNLMIGSEDVDYCPLTPDYDRYLFLEALHSAQEYMLLSYQGYGQQDSKELQPSLIVEELFSYLDKYYTIQGKKVSEICIFKHPFDTFDERYFIKEHVIHNFSQHDFQAAQTHCKLHKSPPHRFLNDFTCIAHPKPSVIEHNSLIDLKHLVAVARNPIKFHLNKVLEIYIQTEEDRKLKTEEELVVSSLDKHQMKHFALKEPIDTVLYKAEREGKLPFGLFKTVATKRLKEEVEDIQECLLRHSVDQANIFQIEFCTGCSQPTQLEEDRWLFPAVSLAYEDGYKLSIVGKLLHATPKGLIALSKGTLADAWKAWPQFLLYCHAAKLCPDRLEPQLILAHSAQPKKAFFDDPAYYLKQFVNYYALCLQNFSPLLPDWIPLILKDDVRGLQDKMRQLFTESFGAYQNHDLRWILNKHRLPSSETMIHYWKSQAEGLLSDLIQFWYNSQQDKYETI